MSTDRFFDSLFAAMTCPTCHSPIDVVGVGVRWCKACGTVTLWLKPHTPTLAAQHYARPPAGHAAAGLREIAREMREASE